MDNNLIFLVGLPGSGKTTMAKLEYPDYFLVDDPTEAPIIDSTRKTIIADCHLCYPKTFNQVIKLYPNSLFILFENNLNQCYQNVLNRNDGRLITWDFMLLLNTEYAKILDSKKTYNYLEVKVYATKSS
jgi:hypothetical protein